MSQATQRYAEPSAASCGSNPVRVMPRPPRNRTSGPEPASRQATGTASTSRASDMSMIVELLVEAEPAEQPQAHLGAPWQHDRAATRVAVVLLERQVAHQRTSAARADRQRGDL